jgi:hypothetical protein
MRDAGAPPLLVRDDAGSSIEIDACLLKTDRLDERRTPHGDEHQVRLHRLAVTEMDGEVRTGLLDAAAMCVEVQRDAAPSELPC